MYTRQKGTTQRVVTTQGAAVHRVHLIGSHPILMHFLARMDFQRIVRSCLATSGTRILDHAQTLAILLQNILLSPAPLYRIAEWARPVDPVALELSVSEKAALNDDRVARSLDALVSPRARSLFFQLALHIIKQFELDTRRIHQDTTTVTLSGEYRGSIRSPRITRGHNKDHKPHLKQLVFGLNVTADGAVPIAHGVYSGNRTDDTIHQSNLDQLRQILGRTDFIYVADSKLCTRKNLAHVAGYGGQFVTVLPRTRIEDRRFREALRQSAPVRWRRLWQQENVRHPDEPPITYATTADGPAQTIEGYRMVWVRSSQKALLDEQGREAALQKAEAQLLALEARLNRGRLRQRQGIRQAVDRILRTHPARQFLVVHIAQRTEVRIQHLRRGRPRSGDPVRRIRIPIYHLELSRDKEALRAEARTDGIFPLVTNLAAGRWSKKDVFQIYKYQPYVEKRHALLKTELEVAPVYLKKPRRVAGLVHAMFLALMLDALIERTLRQSMTRAGIEALPILPEGRLTRTPTTARLLEVFSDVCWYEFERGMETVTFPIELTPLQKQLLGLLGMESSAYP